MEMSSEYHPHGGDSILDEAVVIRRYVPSDLAQVVDLDKSVFGGYDPQLFSTFYEYYPRTILVAEMFGRVVGFVIGFKHTPFEGRIFWLAVRPGYQNRGIGRRLMIALLKAFRSLGAISATLEVRISNRRAQALYAAMGFDVIGTRPGYYSDGEAALIMKKSL